MKDMTGKLVSIETTNGPFGHQWWHIEIDGSVQRFAMWEDFSRWPKRGTTIEIQQTPRRECHIGYGGSKIILKPCARLVSDEANG
jgi:hypothetical protein